MSEGMGAVAPAVSTSANTPKNAAPQKSADVQKNTPENPQESPKKLFKVKVDGQDFEVPEDELLKDYQLKQASQKRFQEAAAKEREAQAVMQAIENGDVKFLEKKLGKEKTKEIFESYLIADLEEAELREKNPGEYRARQLEAENKALKQAQEAEKKALEEQKRQETLQKIHQELDQEVHDALSGLGKKPTPRLAVRVVDEMIARLEAKSQKISAKDASHIAIKGIHEDIKEYLPGLEVSDLLQVIPPEVIDRIRRHEVERVTGELGKRRVKPSTEQTPKKDRPSSIDDFFKFKEKKYSRR